MKILLRKRSNDWQAYLEDHFEIWGCGKTINAAIGDLICSHKDVFKINAEVEKR